MTNKNIPVKYKFHLSVEEASVDYGEIFTIEDFGWSKSEWIDLTDQAREKILMLKAKLWTQGLINYSVTAIS